MNKDNVLKVADAIEKHSIPDLGFNMMLFRGRADDVSPDLSGHNCGTVACIAGWTVAALGDPLTPVMEISSRAMRILGLNGLVADTLFVPSAWGDNSVTPPQAVAVLRHLAETGEVDWSVALGVDERAVA